MAVPKKKTSPSKRNMRRAQNSKIAAINIIENRLTGEMHLPHHITETGYYNGKQAVTFKAKAQEDTEEQEENA
ncbi:50S ribosomal protein L32 [Rickettsiales endosymbiont of Stachyamoeba lipophora]|uniref:50S ribosomal protein L32 n=1 Tax=Rickettsiales endosymbiont of Stachyamoeba lipophora TaxID=2486578 RepID=UPI000F6475A2|nr:50S ribosomal protein L32 [Rickettsiales endosymbiont of Stachyamoeba lipophora]AZL16146.1 50S ribosomal protein L32 [Rickettsiales endosymbiont of Stachyamoeba lipophora]